jgi:hypothetical protein
MNFDTTKKVGLGAAAGLALVLTLIFALRPKPFELSPAQMSGVVMTSEQLTQFLQDRGVPIFKIESGDPLYELPLETWVTNRFCFDFARFVRVAGKTEYIVNRSDCDKYSLLFHALANMVPRNGKRGIAIGEIWTARPAHALGLAVAIDGLGHTNLVAIEPQMPARVGVDVENINSARF